MVRRLHSGQRNISSIYASPLDTCMTVTLYNADNNDVSFPDDAAVVSDPPYGVSNNCDYSRFTNGISQSRNHHRGIAGDDQPFDPSRWLTFPHVALFGYQHFSQHLPTGSVLVWVKKRDNQIGTFCSDAELCWLNRGKGCYVYKHIWNGFDRQTERGEKTLHPSQKPVMVMRHIIQMLKLPKGTTVIDPYAGAGSTLLAAADLGFDVIGCELDEHYCQIAHKRLTDAGHSVEGA